MEEKYISRDEYDWRLTDADRCRSEYADAADRARSDRIRLDRG